MVFSCSGTSHNIVQLIQRAKNARTPVIGVFGFGDRNLLTLDALDRLSRTPEYKLCAIRVEVLSEN